MEGGGLDFLGAAGNHEIVAACREAGGSRVVMSTPAEVLQLETSWTNRPCAFESDGCGIVVTDAPAMHLVRGGRVVRTASHVSGHLTVLKVDNTLHLTCPRGGEWDVLAKVPAARYSQIKTALEDVFTPGPTTHLDPAQLVSSRYPWLQADTKQALGLVVKSAKDAAEHWKTEHEASHVRRRKELEALRARSKSREKKRTEREKKEQHSPQGAGGGTIEEQTLRDAREREAAGRIQQYQEEIANERAKRELAAAAKAAAAKAMKDKELDEAMARKRVADAAHLQKLLDEREEEMRQMEEQRKRLVIDARQACDDRQEEERRIQARKEILQAERREAEDKFRREMQAAKRRKEEEDHAKRREVEQRYEQSQVHRTERQTLVREEAAVRLDILKEEMEMELRLARVWEECRFIHQLEVALLEVETEEAVARAHYDRLEDEERGDVEWDKIKHHAHVCEVERRRLMDEEDRVRRLISGREEERMGVVVGEYLLLQNLDDGAAHAHEFKDPGEDEALAIPGPTPTKLAGASPLPPPTVARPAGREDEGERCTQTPAYMVRGEGEDAVEPSSRVAEELAKLRKELAHERELRMRNEERMADHDRLMRQKTVHLEERERKLLAQLSKEHAKRMEEVRTIIQPKVEKAEAFEEADRLLQTMTEREEEWVKREKEWRVQQGDIERDASRLRDELTRMTELYWLCEGDKSELKGRVEANDAEIASMRDSLSRADTRLRHILLEEQELLVKVEEQWRDKVQRLELDLNETEMKLKRKLEERERYWLNHEKQTKDRAERAERERLQVLEKMEGMRHRMEAAERDRQKLREEMGAETQLLVHRAAAETRTVQDNYDQERRRRVEVEEALKIAMVEQKRLAGLLEDARVRHSSLLRDSQLAAAHHEAELVRISQLTPTQVTPFSIIVAVETAARYGILAQYHEQTAELAHLARRRQQHELTYRPLQPVGLNEHNDMLRELLEIEEAKTGEMERTLMELRRQRDQLAKGVMWVSHEQIPKLLAEEADVRRRIEAEARDDLVDIMTTRRRGQGTYSPHRGRKAGSPLPRRVGYAAPYAFTPIPKSPNRRHPSAPPSPSGFDPGAYADVLSRRGGVLGDGAPAPSYRDTARLRPQPQPPTPIAQLPRRGRRASRSPGGPGMLDPHALQDLVERDQQGEFDTRGAGETEGWLMVSLQKDPKQGGGVTPWKQLWMWIDGEEGVLCGAPANPYQDPAVPTSCTVDLRRVLAVEIDMFLDSSLPPPPVSKYQQLGFYVETAFGSKHRFCAAAVPERTEWVHHLRRAVLRHSTCIYPSSPTSSRARHRSPKKSYRDRAYLEHMSYLAIDGDEPLPSY